MFLRSAPNTRFQQEKSRKRDWGCAWSVGLLVVVWGVLETYGRECAGSGDPRTAYAQLTRVRGREILAQLVSSRLFPHASSLRRVAVPTTGLCLTLGLWDLESEFRCNPARNRVQ